MHGCLPNFVAWAYRESDLLDLVADLHDMSGDQRRKFRDHWMVELHPGIQGAQYAEMDKCWCTAPHVHSED
jgi:hypothetical protein